MSNQDMTQFLKSLEMIKSYFEEQLASEQKKQKEAELELQRVVAQQKLRNRNGR